MQLELNREEWEELLELVRAAYAETNPELHRAASHVYREQTRARRELLAALLQRLEQAAQTTA